MNHTRCLVSKIKIVHLLPQRFKSTKNLRFVIKSINIILDIYNVFLISSVEGNLTPRQAEHFFLVLSCLFPRGEGAGVGRGVRGGGGTGRMGC